MYIIICLLIGAGLLFYALYRYEGSALSQQTNTSYFQRLKSGDKQLQWGIYKKLSALSEKYEVFIDYQEGSNSEVNFLVVHPTSVYLIVPVYQQGWIVGHEQHENWYVLSHGNKRKAFSNPIMDAKRRVKDLDAKLAHVPNELFHILIVFSESSPFQKIELTSDLFYVIKEKDIKYIINKSQ